MAAAEPSPASVDAPPPVVPSMAIQPPSSPPRLSDPPAASPRSFAQITAGASADMEVDSGPLPGDELPAAMDKLNTAEGESFFILLLLSLTILFYSC